MYKQMTTNLMVENVSEAIAFYQDILLFSVVASVPKEDGTLQFAILTKDGFMLMLQERANFIEECPMLATDRVHPSISLYIQVDNLDALHDELSARYPIAFAMHTTFYGAREFAVTDKDGYIVVFAEHQDS